MRRPDGRGPPPHGGVQRCPRSSCSVFTRPPRRPASVPHRPLGADRRQRVAEVAGWRGRRRRPFQRVPFPRVVGVVIDRSVKVRQTFHRNGRVDAPRRKAPIDGHAVEGGEPVGIGVVGHPAGHAVQAQDVLDEERQVEADEGHPEMDLAPPLGQTTTGELREPEVDPAEQREHRAAEQHVVEVGHDEVRVRQLEVEAGRRQHHPRHATDHEDDQEPEREEQRRGEDQLATPQRSDPVEELHPGRDGDEHRRGAEERQEDVAGGEHVVGPHADRQRGDGQGGQHQAPVAEHRPPGEHGEDLGHDAEVGQCQHVHLGVAEEPEQVLPEDRHAPVGRVEDRPAEVPVGEEHDARRWTGPGRPGARGCWWPTCSR